LNLKQALEKVVQFRSDFIKLPGNASATEQQLNTAIGSATPISGVPNQTGLLFGKEIANPKQGVSRRDIEDIASAKGLLIGDDITMVLSANDMTSGARGIALKYSLSKYMDSGLDFVKFDENFAAATQTGASKTMISALSDAPDAVGRVVYVDIQGGLGLLAGGTALSSGVSSPGTVGPKDKKIPVFDTKMVVNLVAKAADDASDGTTDGVINFRTSIADLDAAHIDFVQMQGLSYKGGQYKVNVALGSYDALFNKALSASGF